MNKIMLKFIIFSIIQISIKDVGLTQEQEQKLQNNAENVIDDIILDTDKENK